MAAIAPAGPLRVAYVPVGPTVIGDAITPQAAIYLTVQFNLHGQKTTEGKILETTADITKYLLDEAKLAIVPFSAFGASGNSSWYRLSVGTCKLSDVEGAINNIKNALSKLC